MNMGRKFRPGHNFFGKLHHPAIGIRIPEIFLPGIIAALKKRHCAASLMLSFGRETGPEHVVRSPAYKYPITLAHTGTSIRHYQGSGSKAAREAGIPVEIEADHLIVIGSPERAATRITGVHGRDKVSEKALRRSIRYIYSELKEAKKAGVCRCFTIDTSDLFNHEAMELSGSNLEKAFSKTFPLPRQKRLIEKYGGKKFLIPLPGGRSFSIRLTDESLMRLALRYKMSLEVSRVIYQRIRKDFGQNFGFEISLDETDELTRLEDAFFYLSEWTAGGCHFDYFAPNIGFEKRADYRGPRADLRDRVRRLAAVASYFNGALLSIHSGSGSTPYSGKGRGVYEALLSATGSRLKYKISGVYYELLLEVLSGYPAGSRQRILFEDIFAAVTDYCKKEVTRKGPLATNLLKDQLRQYLERVKKYSGSRYSPRTDFFRFHSYLALNLRGRHMSRPFREALVQLYNEDRSFRRKVDREVQGLTERLIQGLKFSNNY
jgi:hypothetical protein